MRLILGSNMTKPSIRDIILISSGAGYCSYDGGLNMLTHNRMILKNVGRNEYAKLQYRVKYGGKFGDRLIKFGKSFYNKILKPGYNHVVKPVYNATKKLVDIAANNDLANNAIKVVGNLVGTAVEVPGLGNMLSKGVQGVDSAIKISESVVNELVDKKKMDPKDVKEVIDIVSEQVKDFSGNDKQTLDNKVNTVKENLQNLDLQKENLTPQDVKEGFKAGLIFYNPVSRKPINKYSGRCKMGGSIKPINPNLLKIMPKLFKKKAMKKEIQNAGSKSNGRVKMAGRAKMSGEISKSQMNEITNKLEALKSKYK